ncbi:serine/threonine-protein kinase [Pseudoduganella ginsengisoli]|nr:serine/threonine-protein kinase [Pseudoduganella ginsengisoli]
MDTLTQLGRYHLLRVLGRGTSGLVYEGLDPALGRQVAIKVIPLAQPEDGARFMAEAQAVARLNHPHIVTVYDFGEQQGAAYLVMELITGEDLASYFDDSQQFSLEFTLEDSVRIVCELLDALDYAHQQGLVHHDVKPANVLLTDQLRVKLTDFGMAYTPGYMSPEQIMGQEPGAQADLFAAGIILYQFLTGTHPFKGASLLALQQHIAYGAAAAPSTLCPAIGTAFDPVVQRALARQPAARYPTACAFRDALQHALSITPSKGPVQ